MTKVNEQTQARKEEIQNMVLADMHKLFLEALRQREQDIMRYLAILGPALAGYIWLLSKIDDIDKTIVTIGIAGIIFVLLVGAVYSVALGYNYRYITMQLAKMESKMKIRPNILAAWPREVKDFRKIYCEPPEIIKVFWISFLTAIIGIGVATCFFEGFTITSCKIIPLSLFAFQVGFYSPIYYGRKLRKICKAEGPCWDFSDK